MSDRENNQKNDGRIDRQTDENLYQPKIHSQRIRELHDLSERSGLPMTVLVDRAIQDFVERNSLNKGVIYEEDEIVTSEIKSFITRAYQIGHDEGIRYIWLNVVDPLVSVNISLNRGDTKEAADRLDALDLWIKENLNIPTAYERNREGDTKGA
ncbi:MAG TPA: hypothetical protein VJ327_01165 [Patescibacteria group bacterium]|nr:MAG: hypothetical protein A2899_02960 [Candidatus Amesbacteria bacterium RIFCSPLOWO2_01_FULL_49_25]HJZ04455.1 hypothetical protein [Patescibacteria group bacterium]